MKRLIIILAAAVLSAGMLGAQAPEYDKYFTDDRLRIDFTPY